MKKILIVEDEEVERTFLKRLFEMEIKGYEVIGEACNGNEAIKFIKDHSPDIIFMDVKMPGIDGLKATQMIKILKPQIHIIILTAYEEFKFAQEALRAGAEEYLLKPAQPSEISMALNNINSRVELSTDITEGFSSWEDKSEVIGYNKEKILIKALQNSDTKLLQFSLDEYFEYLMTSTKSPSVLKIRLFEFITILTRTLCDAGFNPSKAHEFKMKLYEKISFIDNFSDIEVCMADIKDELEDASKANNSNNKELIKSVLNYIKANMSKDLSLENVADRFHFSTSYLSRLIKRETGSTYSEYLNNLRLAEAKNLLRNSDMNINTIAIQVGYNEVTHFNRVFKKAVGINPTKYRKIMLND